MTPRAAPLPPEERRASILAAARPLLVEHGADLTTKQVAEAAGIAEGTVFRVFPTKQDLLTALMEQALDPTDVIAALAGLPAGQTLTERTVAVVEALAGGISRVTEVFTALGMAHHTAPADREGHRERHRAAHGDALGSAVVAALAPYADELTTTPEVAARLLHVIAFTSAHPLLSRGELLPREELARVMLTGLAKDTSC